MMSEVLYCMMRDYAQVIVAIAFTAGVTAGVAMLLAVTTMIFGSK